MSLGGQIVGILDSVFAIFFNKLAPKGLSTRSLIPILQINSSSYRQDVHDSVINSLRDYKHGEMALVPHGGNAPFLAAMVTDAKQLSGYHAKLAAIAKIFDTDATQSKRIVRAAQTMSEQMHVLLRRSGIFDAHYFSDMLQSLQNPTPNIEAELKEAYLMLQELRWQLLKLTRICFSIAEDESALQPDRRALLLQAMQALSALSSR